VSSSASTQSDTYVPLGGPSVTLTVQPSGLVELWAQATLDDDEGAVGPFRDGQLVPGQASDACGPDGDGALLDGDPSAFGSPLTLGTGGGGNFGVAACGSLGPPEALLIQAPPGRRTFELRYAECSCAGGGTATFSDRSLRIAPRP
jgi:hypothetical protein